MNIHILYATEAEEPFILITRCEGELIEEEIQFPISCKKSPYLPFFNEFRKKDSLSYAAIPFNFTKKIAEANPSNATEFTVPSLTDVNEPILQISKTGNLWLSPTIQKFILINRSGKTKMSVASSHGLSEENIKEKMETLENGDKLIAWFSDHSKVSIEIEFLVN
jgi:hypothetical protein